jgi:hypothetical protein
MAGQRWQHDEKVVDCLKAGREREALQLIHTKLLDCLAFMHRLGLTVQEAEEAWQETCIAVLQAFRAQRYSSTA